MTETEFVIADKSLCILNKSYEIHKACGQNSEPLSVKEPRTYRCIHLKGLKREAGINS